ncbi:MAG: GTPase Era [Patescibacteria group bacterium]
MYKKEPEEKQEFKSGFVALVGRSNVGKSTLLNSLVGTKVAITTPKPQTTRDVIHGIVHDERGQIVFIDTPGIFQQSKDNLTSKLTQKAKESIQDVDLILYIVDPTREIGNEEKSIQNILRAVEIPKIMVINKVDLPSRPFEKDFLELKDDFNDVIQISALKLKHLKPLKDLIFTYLKPGERFYPDYQLTSMDNKTWFAELIREKFFLALEKELPYKLTVEVEELETRENGVIYVKANIITSQESHKGMLIGRGGRLIKELGSSIRRQMEQLTGTRVFLDLNVVVNPRWVEQIK